MRSRFRQISFQVHLWAGVVLAIYVTIIGLTGSVLVFGAELKHWGNAKPPIRPVASLQTIVSQLRISYPNTHIVSVTAPDPFHSAVTATLGSSTRIRVQCDATTGQVIGRQQESVSRLDWIYDLHENLLARRTGRVVNGAGAAGLVLLVLTGLVNWWPSMKNLRRAITVDFRRRWKRVNYDIHSAVGFWSASFLFMWALSGIYFAWPDRMVNFVSHFSPVINARPPAIAVNTQSEMHHLDFDALLATAYSVDPGTHWKELIFPANRRSPFELLLSRSQGADRDDEDTMYFNPYDGRYIAIWRYGVKKSAADWFIWLQIPLHFGTHWGVAVKCLWALAGVLLPLLAITGLLMYWNRFLSKQWRRA